MNIFVAGVHGVGKTYLASQLSAEHGLTHTSASKIIKAEMARTNWSEDKRVKDVTANQVALIAGVRRYNDSGSRLLLDGHFVLLNLEGDFSRLDSEVFRSLNLDGVVLLETAPDTIAARIRQRDGVAPNTDHIARFIEVEREHAQLVCDDLHIPLRILSDPTPATFAAAVSMPPCSNVKC